LVSPWYGYGPLAPRKFLRGAGQAAYVNAGGRSDEISLDSSTDGLVVKGYLIDVVKRVGRLFTSGDGCFEANHLDPLELDALRRIGIIMCLHAAQTTRLWLVRIERR